MQGLKQKKVNFIERLQEDPKRDAATGRRLRVIVPLCALVFVILLVYSYIAFFLNGQLQKELDGYIAYMDDVTVQEDYLRVLGLTVERNLLQMQAGNTREVFDSIDSYVEIDRDLYNAFNDPAVDESITVDNYQFDRSTGILTLECTGANELSASSYVKELRESGDFVATNYVGYSGSQGEYSFSVTCLVIQGGGAAL